MAETTIFNVEEIDNAVIEKTIKEVHDILAERGYNPINQLVGYIMSGDAGYISSHQEARTKITELDRIRIIEVLVKKYLGK